MIAAQPASDVSLVPLGGDYADYRRDVIFQCCKWDPQVGDVNTISDHAAVLDEAAAAHLSHTAERLAAETIALEQALVSRPDLYAQLALPKKLHKLLQRPSVGAHVRVMRFDFHPTPTGWAVSEVNSDVPGGFAEASMLPLLAAARTNTAHPSGDVADALVTAMSHRIAPRSRIAFVHATAYTDDRQVMHFLATRFAAAGFETALLAPDHLRFEETGRAHAIADGRAGPVDAIVRFYPAEWMPMLPRSSGWQGYFGAAAVMANPPSAMLTQSKRLPLVWDQLGLPTPAWREALPETRDPREAPWRTDETWLVKPALGRVGEDVAWRSSSPAKDWRKLSRTVAMFPRQFVAQRRFESRALPTRDGPRNLCVGVFTVDGRAAGFYGRLSARPIIDKHAQDIAVLVAAPAVTEQRFTEHRHVA